MEVHSCYLKKDSHFDYCKNIDFQCYKGVYGLDGFDELPGRFVDGIFLHISAVEDGLDVFNECGDQRYKITFESYAEEGRLAVFSDGYTFELNADHKAIAVRHGGTRWVLWGR